MKTKVMLTKNTEGHLYAWFNHNYGNNINLYSGLVFNENETIQGKVLYSSGANLTISGYFVDL